jgi:glutamate/tyrosine decarboxylase-like PLP-dependent enzyme
LSGSDALGLIPAGVRHRIDLNGLREAYREGSLCGRTPFLVVGTAGTV